METIDSSSLEDAIAVTVRINGDTLCLSLIFPIDSVITIDFKVDIKEIEENSQRKKVYEVGDIFGIYPIIGGFYCAATRTQFDINRYRELFRESQNAASYLTNLVNLGNEVLRDSLFVHGDDHPVLQIPEDTVKSAYKILKQFLIDVPVSRARRY